jgi:hypothetical protein
VTGVFHASIVEQYENEQQCVQQPEKYHFKEMA